MSDKEVSAGTEGDSPHGATTLPPGRLATLGDGQFSSLHGIYAAPRRRSKEGGGKAKERNGLTFKFAFNPSQV